MVNGLWGMGPMRRERVHTHRPWGDGRGLCEGNGLNVPGGEWGLCEQKVLNGPGGEGGLCEGKRLNFSGGAFANGKG